MQRDGLREGPNWSNQACDFLARGQIGPIRLAIFLPEAKLHPSDGQFSCQRPNRTGQTRCRSQIGPIRPAIFSARGQIGPVRPFFSCQRPTWTCQAGRFLASGPINATIFFYRQKPNWTRQVGNVGLQKAVLGPPVRQFFLPEAKFDA